MRWWCAGCCLPDLGYEEARELYAPFDRLVNEDPGVRGDITELVLEALAEGRPVYVTVNNKAEGSAPVSIERLAAAVVERLAPACAARLSPPGDPESGGRR